MTSLLTDVLAWSIVALLGVAALLDARASDPTAGGTGGAGDGGGRDAAGTARSVGDAGTAGATRRQARLVGALAWVAFGAFWLLLVPHFWFAKHSFIEATLALVAVPLCLRTALLQYRGRDSLFLVGRAVAAMGVIYLTFETIPAVTLGGTTIPAPREMMIELVAGQAAWLSRALGYHPNLVVSSDGYLDTLQYTTPEGRNLHLQVLFACTGVGSMTIFAGVVAAVRAPLRQKLKALAVSMPIIYALNLLRVTFVGIVFGNQYMQWFVPQTLAAFGATDPYTVSFLLADKVVSQILALVALVVITLLVARQLPTILSVVEDLLYIVVGREYDFSTLEARLESA